MSISSVWRLGMAVTVSLHHQPRGMCEGEPSTGSPATLRPLCDISPLPSNREVSLQARVSAASGASRFYFHHSPIRNLALDFEESLGSKPPESSPVKKHAYELIAGRKDSLPSDCDTSEGSKEVLVIIGGSSASAATIALEWLKGGGFREVIFTVRNASDVPGMVEMEALGELKDRVSWVKASSEDYKSSERMTEILEAQLGDKKVLKLGMVSCIGCSIPSASQTLDEINVEPVVNTTSAIIEVAVHRKIQHVGLGVISSIAASLVDVGQSEYVASRVKADEKFLELLGRARMLNPGMHINGVALRPGLIESTFGSKDAVAEFHPYDVKQLLDLWGVIVPGSGEQEIPVVAIEDLARALVNCIDSEEDLLEIIDVITNHHYTYNQIMEFFAGRLDRGYKKFHITSEVFNAAATEIPYGRLAPYAAKMFDVLDHTGAPKFSEKAFMKLLGQPALSLEDMYPKGKYDFGAPPILKHVVDATNRIYGDPMLLLRLIGAVVANSPELVVVNTGRPAKQPGLSKYAKKIEY